MKPPALCWGRITQQYGLLLIFGYLFYVGYQLAKHIDYTKKLIRVTQINHDITLTVIMKKLKITQEDIKQTEEEYRELITEENWKVYQQETHEVFPPKKV